MSAKAMTQKIMDAAGAFIVRQEGVWGHAEWEAFLTEMKALGLPDEPAAKAALGSMLESGKVLFRLSPPPAKKIAAAKPKSATARKPAKSAK